MYFLVLETLSGIFLAALAVQLMVNGLEDLHIIAVWVHETLEETHESSCL